MRFSASIWLGVMRLELERLLFGCAALAAERIFPDAAKVEVSCSGRGCVELAML